MKLNEFIIRNEAGIVAWPSTNIEKKYGIVLKVENSFLTIDT